MQKLNDTADDLLDGRKRKENLYIIKQLIEMFSCLDFFDIHGK
jgi:hypothetical protein